MDNVEFITCVFNIMSIHNVFSYLDYYVGELCVCKAKEFVFYDGPPFATGLPHYGHLLAGTQQNVWVSQCRLSQLPSDTKKKSKTDGLMQLVKIQRMLSLRTNSSSSNGNAEKEADSGPYELLETMTGASLVGLRYTPLFDYFVDEFSDTDKAFTVVADNYVTDDSGTGVVHCAPAFVEEDHRVCIENKIIQKGKNLTVAVDDDGCFTEKASHFCGRYVKDADKDFINDVKGKSRSARDDRGTAEIWPNPIWRVNSLLADDRSSYVTQLSKIIQTNQM